MSRHRKVFLIVCFLILLLLFIWVDRSYISRNFKSQPKTAEKIQQNDFVKYHKRNFTVVKVIDGDTIDIDIPHNKYNHTRIRLLGIDTPETKNYKTGTMYFGPQAADFTKELVLQKQVVVYLDTNNKTRGKYGRLLAYIQIPDGRFLNEVLLKEGFAYADLRFRHSCYNKYKNLEAIARKQKKGLWNAVTTEQLPQWLQKRKSKIKLQ